jgi:hypothetical protein
MYASPRVLTTSAPDLGRPSRFTLALSMCRTVGVVLALVAYLVFCLGANVARLGRTALVGWARGLLREQRRMRRILITTAIFALAVIFGVSASGTTLALWNRATPIGSVSVATGSTGITVNGATTYTVPGLTTTQLLPGLSAVSPQVLTITNTGTTALSIAPGAPVFSDPTSLLAQNSNLIVVLFQSTTCAQSVDGSSTPAWTTPVVVAPGGTISACLQTTLSATAPSTVQGLSASFTMPLVGTQVRNNS